jgi:hypothetical protein
MLDKDNKNLGDFKCNVKQVNKLEKTISISDKITIPHLKMLIN